MRIALVHVLVCASAIHAAGPDFLITTMVGEYTICAAYYEAVARVLDEQSAHDSVQQLRKNRDGLLDIARGLVGDDNAISRYSVWLRFLEIQQGSFGDKAKKDIAGRQIDQCDRLLTNEGRRERMLYWADHYKALTADE